MLAFSDSARESCGGSAAGWAGLPRGAATLAVAPRQPQLGQWCFVEEEIVSCVQGWYEVGAVGARRDGRAGGAFRRGGVAIGAGAGRCAVVAGPTGRSEWRQ